MTKRKPGFLFDLDGVLINSKEFHYQAWQHLSKENNLLDITYDYFSKTFGMRNDEILKALNFYQTQEEIDKAGARKEELFRLHCKEHVKLIEGMQPFLEEVKKASITRIIASNTPVENLNFFLNETILGSYFDAFVSGEEVKAGKPSPDVFIEAARRIGYDTKDCIVFEDSPHGLIAGKNAGCFVVALGTTTPEILLNPKDAYFKSPKDLNLQQILTHYYAM
jgi:beta-phosphoglucomutase